MSDDHQNKLVAQQENASQLVPETNYSENEETSDSSSESSLEGNIVKTVVCVSSCITTVFYKFTV